MSDEATACPKCGRPVHVPAATAPMDERTMRMLVPVGRSGWAIAAGYVALFATVIFPLAPIALVLGLVAVRDIRSHPDKHGMGRAVFGIVVGVGWIVAAAVLMAVFRR